MVKTISRISSSLHEIWDIEKGRKYLCSEYLGSGSFGNCCVLKTDESRKLFVGKFVRPPSNRCPEMWNMIEKEISIHQSISHKNIVKFIDHFFWNGHIVYLLEYCQFGTLLDVLKNRGKVIEIEGRYYIEQVFRALSYLHSKSIIHGDIKPANIFISMKMRIKLGDFGLSRALGIRDVTTNKSFNGTPNYMSPEMIAGQPYGCPSDIWAAGCTFYILLCGTTPFETNDIALTMNNILHCRYNPYIGFRRQVVRFFNLIFRLNPLLRLTSDELLADQYLTINCIPTRLPKTYLVQKPEMRDIASLIREKQTLKRIHHSKQK